MPTTLTNPHQAWTGSRYLDLQNPDPSDLDIRDIAIGLTRQRRYAGLGTTIPWSITHHTLFCAFMAYEQDGIEDEAILAAILMHDAPEFVLGDVIQPLKSIPAVKAAYTPLESAMYSAMAFRWNLLDPLPPIYKHYDNIAGASERAELIPDVEPWPGHERIEVREIPDWLLSMTEVTAMNTFLKYAQIWVTGDDYAARTLH